MTTVDEILRAVRKMERVCQEASESQNENIKCARNTARFLFNEGRWKEGETLSSWKNVKTGVEIQWIVEGGKLVERRTEN